MEDSDLESERRAGRALEVFAPSRLHFGMLSFGNPEERQFGGVGAMIDAPGLRVRISGADRLEILGPLRERVEALVQRFSESASFEAACRVELVSVPPAHCGLGVGTSLGLSVLRGLRAFYDLPDSSPEELAIESGRGLRSAVGTYGFFSGGMIFESGKMADEPLAPLVRQIDLPEDWRFVLLLHQASEGTSGEAELKKFASLPAVPSSVTERLRHEVVSRWIPAALEQDFDAFSASLFRYGHLAGSCFSEAQGGPFADLRLEQLVEKIRASGLEGVGQTSWGPTLFALLPDESSAIEFVARMQKEMSILKQNLLIASPDNQGARIVQLLVGQDGHTSAFHDCP